MLQVLHQNIELVYDSVCKHILRGCVTTTESHKLHITAHWLVQIIIIISAFFFNMDDVRLLVYILQNILYLMFNKNMKFSITYTSRDHRRAVTYTDTSIILMGKGSNTMKFCTY
jgi:hypothetical protein